MRSAHAMSWAGHHPSGGHRHGPWHRHEGHGPGHRHEGEAHHELPGWLAMTGHGRGPWGPGGFGPGGPGGRGWGGRGWGGGRGSRARRGDVRLALLALLAEEPRNGYALMQAINERSGGVWRPSPGSVYPALQQLEDEGLVRVDDSAGRRALALTDEGRAHVQEREREVAAVWDAVRGEAEDPRHELRGLLGQVGGAVHQVAMAGGEAQVAEAKRLLTETRRALYRLLADDEPGGEADER